MGVHNPAHSQLFLSSPSLLVADEDLDKHAVWLAIPSNRLVKHVEDELSYKYTNEGQKVNLQSTRVRWSTYSPRGSERPVLFFQGPFHK